MKTRNPRSRYHLSVKRSDKVLEVGGGHNPHPRSNMVVDKFIESNYHRHSGIKVLKNQQFMQADGENMPFKDNEYDYVISNQVLEHTENPQAFVNEISRVGKRGYIEVPSLIGEYLFPKESHRWVILEIENKLVLVEKAKIWPEKSMDFGLLFLTWLPKYSAGYKILMNTHPNFMTIRYEWKDSIEIVVNPTEEKYMKYFTEAWNEDMINEFFVKRSKLMEAFLAIYELKVMLLRTLGFKRIFPRV